MRPITKLIIHVSDSPDTMDVGVREINDWHKQRGFKSVSGINIGYHFVVRRSGAVELGRPVKEIGAHCNGLNATSIGICWVGRNNCTPAQWTSLISIATILCEHYKLPTGAIHGHNEFSTKTCPNIDVAKLRAAVASTIDHTS